MNYDTVQTHIHTDTRTYNHTHTRAHTHIKIHSLQAVVYSSGVRYKYDYD